MSYIFDPGRPLYPQLSEHLTQAILAGAWPPGGRLPSVRELAAEMGVNPNTMQRALAELERQELVYTARTAGRFVTENTDRIAAVRSRMAADQTQAFAARMRALGYTKAELLAALTALPDEPPKEDAYE